MFYLIENKLFSVNNNDTTLHTFALMMGIPTSTRKVDKLKRTYFELPNQFFVDKVSRFGVKDIGVETLPDTKKFKVRKKEPNKFEPTFNQIDWDFPKSQYVNQIHPKRQVTLHHPVSNPLDWSGDFKWWLSNKERVATCGGVGWNGDYNRMFSSLKYAYHIYLRSRANKIPAKYKTRKWAEYIERTTIGLEIDGFGPLVERNGRFYSVYNHNVNSDQVITYNSPYRGHLHYQIYSEDQIETVRQLLLLWKDYHKIPVNYSDDIWDVTERAYGGEKGVFSHTSYRTDKSDCHPYPPLIEMLKSIS